MYCLDTSVIIDIFDGKQEIKEKLENLSQKEISISPIILCELYKGAIHSKITEKRIEFINRLLENTSIVEFNQLSCQIFGQDYSKLKKIGKSIKDTDLMISSMCKAHDAVLITKDKKDFENIPDLKLETW